MLKHVRAWPQSACQNMFGILQPPSLIQNKLKWANILDILSHTYYIKCATWKKLHENLQIFSRQIWIPEKRAFSAILEGQTESCTSRCASTPYQISFQTELFAMLEANSLHLSMKKTDFSLLLPLSNDMLNDVLPHSYNLVEICHKNVKYSSSKLIYIIQHLTCVLICWIDDYPWLKRTGSSHEVCCHSCDLRQSSFMSRP